MFTNIINSSAIHHLEAQNFLSEAEQKIYNSRQSPQRQQRFLTGRMLAKYMLLHQITNEKTNTKLATIAQQIAGCTKAAEARKTIINFQKATSENTPQKTSEFSLNHVNEQDLAHFPSCLYQKIEILPTSSLVISTDTQKGTATNKSNSYLSILWCKEQFPIQISIAHHDNISLVSLSKKHPLGLDMESCEQRVDAFYKNSFTSKEKDWVFEKMQQYNVSKNWLFTLLWTCKEAALKLLSQEGMSLSLWKLPALEIDILKENNLDILKEAHKDGLHYFKCQINLNIYAKAIPVQACIAFNNKKIITKLKTVDGRR